MDRLEIRTFDGDGAALAELTNRAWGQTVAGKALYPLWSAPYFDWRLLDPRGGGCDFLVAAYKGTRLVGCILGEPLDFRVGERTVRGTLSSWLTADPEHTTVRVAMRMVAELKRRHQEHGMAFSMGFNDVVSRPFWESLAKHPSSGVRPLGEPAMWSRIFDGRVVSEASLTRDEAIATRAVSYLPGLQLAPRSTVRSYISADLPRCLRWVEAQSRGADLAIQWSAERLDVQLGHPFARTLVLEDGERGGFINYYPMQLQGKAPVNVGIIDLFAGDLGLRQQLALLSVACRRMREEGLHMASMMRSAAAPQRVFALGGFMPYPAGLELFTFFTDPSLDLPSPLRHHILFG